MSYYVLSFSGGKDSTALLLLILQKKLPLDEVVFFDTGWEFEAMYKHIEHVKLLCANYNIKFSTLLSSETFDYYFNKVPKKDGSCGYSWCGRMCRWGTSIKISTIKKYLQRYDNCYQYIGIAYDEIERCKNDPKCLYPLVTFNITEKQALQMCYDFGFTFGGLYNYFDRVSCKCCRNKNLKELRNMYKFFPNDWQDLKNMQLNTSIPFRDNCTIFDLEKRFQEESLQMTIFDL